MIKGKIVTDGQTDSKERKHRKVRKYISESCFLHLGFIVHFLESGDKQLHKHIT